MTRFKIGDRVILEGVIEEMDSSDLPLKVRYGGDVGAYEWIQDGPHIHHVRHDIGLLPMQLEAITKERDDAREQLARVCAQVETLGAELKDARTEVARLRVLEPTFQEYQAINRDRRILDCVATLLAMREAP